MKPGPVVHGSQRMNPSNLGDILTSPLAPPAGQTLNY